MIRIDPGFVGWSVENYEPHVMKWLSENLRRGGVFLDVGAHVGFVSLAASRCVGEEGFVVSVEPSPSSSEILRRHLRMNNARNVQVLDCAVGAVAGEIEFFARPTGTDPGGCANSMVYRIDGGVPVRVKVRPLDDVVAEQVFVPSVIKIDVEGAEFDVLRGAEKTLREHQPKVLCAMHPEPLAMTGCTPADLVKFMSGLGFDCQGLDGRGMTSPGFEEVVFLPREKRDALKSVGGEDKSGMRKGS